MMPDADPLHPLQSRTSPTSEGADKTGQRLPSSNSRFPAVDSRLPAPPPNHRDTPSQAPFPTPSSLFRPGEKLPAPLGPQLSGSRPSDSPPDSWEGPTPKANLRWGVPSLQGSTEHFTVDFVFISFLLRLKNSLVIRT